MGEFAAEIGNRVGERGAVLAKGGRSRGGRREAEIGDLIVQKRAAKGVETMDAGSLHSRRRLSTTGLEDPLPMVRLPERIDPEPASAESSESRSVSNGRLQTVRVAHRRPSVASCDALPAYPIRHKLAGAGPRTEFSGRTG